MRGHINIRARRARQNSARSIFVVGTIAIAVMGIFALAAFTSTPTTKTVVQPTALPSSATDGIRFIKKDGGHITRDDVIKYVQMTGMPATINRPSSITITRAELLTSSTISARLHDEQTGYPNEALLWFVEIRGTFVFSGPPGQTVTSHTGYQVFDPTSGNLVMFGGMG